MHAHISHGHLSSLSLRLDTKKEGNDVDQTFSAYRDFDSSELLTDVQDELCEQISKELVDLIFNSTLGNW